MEKNSISPSHPAQPKRENLSMPEFKMNTITMSHFTNSLKEHSHWASAVEKNGQKNSSIQLAI
jgi:hypothetical protein